MASFSLEGVTYYQQGRRCGRATCKCAQGELHGPYWYGRDMATGKVSYIGRELPQAVERARRDYNRLVVRMDRYIRDLSAQLEAVTKLRRYEPLTEQDRAVLRAMELGDALVQDVPPDEHKTDKLDRNDPANYAQPPLVPQTEVY